MLLQVRQDLHGADGMGNHGLFDGLLCVRFALGVDLTQVSLDGIRTAILVTLCCKQFRNLLMGSIPPRPWIDSQALHKLGQSELFDFAWFV